MIVFKFDNGDLDKKVSAALGEFGDQTPNVLKNALNSTARQARNLLDDQAKKTYAIGKSGFAKEMKLKSATKSRLAATITTKGPVTDLAHFKVSPKPSVGGIPPEMIRAQVKQGGGYKDLVVGSRKAFFIRFKSGHVAIAQRKGDARLPVKTLYSISVPKMVGNEESVLNIVKPKIGDLLEQEVKKQMNSVVKKAAKAAS